jgi:hypothetical protein
LFVHQPFVLIQVGSSQYGNTMQGDEDVSLDDSLNEDDIIAQGLRQTRERTNWLYRGTAMTTTDLMDINEIHEDILHTQNFHQYLVNSYIALSLLRRSRIALGLHDTVRRLKEILSFLELSILSIVCYIEMLYMDIEDRVYYVHQVRPNPPSQKRRIDDLRDNNEAEGLFGFKIHELRSLMLHWRIPTDFSSSNHVFTGEEAMLVYLYYIRTGTPFTRMSQFTFGGDPRKFTFYVRAMTDHLYCNFYHKMSGDSMRQWAPLVSDFRRAIHNKLMDGIVHQRQVDGTENDYEVLVPFHNFRIFGWLDDTDLRTTRPRPARIIQANSEVTQLLDTQQAFYK